MSPSSVAATARGILSCPTSVALLVDGVADVLADLDAGSGLALTDQDGVPTFSCAAGARLAQAAARGRRALLTLEGPEGDVLTLGGRLAPRGRDACACCSEARDVLVLVVDLVALAAPGAAPQHLPAEDFGAPEHRLNAGFLRSCAEHATAAHQDELRHAVAALVGVSSARIAGVALGDLSAAGVTLHWVDASGAHARRVRFPRPAHSPADLGELLRHELSAGLC